MLPAIKAARLRSVVQRSAISVTFGRHRTLHGNANRLNSAEAAPAARPARYESEPKPSALDDIAARRAKAGKLIAGVAAASNSDMFKGSVR